MRRSPLNLYTPLLIVVLIQALIISVAPSRSVQPTIDTAFVPGAGVAPTTGAPGTTSGGTAGTSTNDQGATATTDGSTTGAPGTPTGGGSGTNAGTGTTGSTGTSNTGSTGTGTGSTGSGTETTSSTTGQPVSAGDTSHCVGDRQHDVYFAAPVCKPKWEGGDNGGATHRGVTAETVKIVYFREAKNEQVTTALNAYNLRATRAEEEEYLAAAQDFLNEYNETYGRTIEFVVFDATNCPESPPDIPACRAEVQRVLAEEDPFIVMWPIPNYPEVFDEFVKNEVIALGGWHFDNNAFAGRRPYRYDVFMDGTRSAQIIGEYYCQKLVGGMATHAGQIIHPEFPNGGARDTVPRKLGVLIPETPAHQPTGQLVVDTVRACGGEANLYPYNTNAEDSSAQAQAYTAAMISDQVTTVTCMCDPVAPITVTTTFNFFSYYPEHLLPGMGLLDYDLLGRLYDKQQWQHAFGPSHLQVFRAHSDSDASRIWRASGRSGNACASCNSLAAYANLAGALVHNGGAFLTPRSVEQGMLSLTPRGGWAQTGGDPTVVALTFGQGDYTAISDFKEVYWSETAISKVDGAAGAYVPMDGGRRYFQGELTNAFDVPRSAN